MRFADRAEAGRQLGAEVARIGLQRPIVLGLPRGGVPVADEVALALGAPLDVFVARKIGAPGHEELGIGAVAEGLRVDEPVLSPAAGAVGVTPSQLAVLAADAMTEVRRRVRRYRGDRAIADVAGRDVVVVDDGLATGVTAQAAVAGVRNLQPAAVVLAAPVCAPETAARLRPLVDDLVCLLMPHDLVAVGSWYENFRQTTDEEVLELLRSRA
ncbi:MAG TPA: phosphoribosyltransferase family protein [Nocardioides sp.]|nr:phosphoribosyltransferase family protein [Nocardioides sp.]